MKASFFSFLALPALFLTTFAAPTAEPETAVLETRQVADAYGIVSNLFSEVQQYTGAINATAASLSADSTPHEKKVAARSYRKNVKHITAAVKSAKAQVDALPASAKLARRQTGDALAALVAELLEDISGALNNIIGTLGLGALLGSLNPLVSSLSALLISLRNVVDNLLALVKQIVDGLLNGLSIGLAGLNL